MYSHARMPMAAILLSPASLTLLLPLTLTFTVTFTDLQRMRALIAIRYNIPKRLD